MSILKVDTINEKTSGNGVEIAHDLKGSGIAGHVVQAVQHLHATTSTGNLGRVDLNASGFNDIYSQNITTKLANSVIYVTTTCIGYANTSALRAQGRILYSTNGGTNFYEIYRDPYAWYADTISMTPHTLTHLHSPSVAAGTTIIYKLQASRVGSGTHFFKYADGGGTTHNNLTLMEIAQ